MSTQSPPNAQSQTKLTFSAVVLYEGACGKELPFTSRDVSIFTCGKKKVKLAGGFRLRFIENWAAKPARA